MRFAFNEEQETLRRTARRFLDTASSPDRVRAAMATETGYDPDAWRRISEELGWPSLLIPEAYGGAGLGYVELVAVMEETGRSLLPAPLFSTVCLATNALLVAGTEAQKQEILPGIAVGRTTATLAYAEPSGRAGAKATEATASRDGEDVVLSGVKSQVLDGHTADVVIVAARELDGSADEGMGLFLVPGSASGLARRPLPTMDATRRLAEIRLHDVRVPMSSRLDGDGAVALRKTLDLACIALAAEQLGGMQRCLDMAVDYAKTRVQFGRIIGSFQAVKHLLADMFVKVESARSASYYAGWAAASADTELPALAALTKAYCSEAYFHCASSNIQVHGGIGFTWEHDAHLHFKRARASEALFGDPSQHREALAHEMGLDDSTAR